MRDTDPTTLIESLDVEELRAELHALERRQSALRVLLRAALARQRDDDRQRRTKPAEVCHGK
jgi:hypothetical protein